MPANNQWMLVLIATLGCLALVVFNRARDQRMKMVLGGLGVAAVMIAIALLVDTMRQ